MHLISKLEVSFVTNCQICFFLCVLTVTKKLHNAKKHWRSGGSLLYFVIVSFCCATFYTCPWIGVVGRCRRRKKVSALKKKKKTRDILWLLTSLFRMFFLRALWLYFLPLVQGVTLPFFYNALDFHGRSGPVDLQNFKKLSTIFSPGLPPPPSCTVSCWNKCESLSLLSLERCLSDFYDGTARDYHLF